jgi:hypothetical protein
LPGAPLPGARPAQPRHAAMATPRGALLAIQAPAILPGPRPSDPPGYDQGSEFVAAWPVPTGGWDAALSFWQGESLRGRDLWHWRRDPLDEARTGADPRHGQLRQVPLGPRGCRRCRGDPRPLSSRSPPALAAGGDPRSSSPGPGPVAVGNDHRTWLSEDGRTWVELPPVGTPGADDRPSVADGPAGVIGIGVGATGNDEAPVWQLR